MFRQSKRSRFKLLVLLVVSLCLVSPPAQVRAGEQGAKAKPQPETVRGYVADCRVTGNNERMFWDVETGLNAVTLLFGKDDDRIGAVCLWDKGAAPAVRIREGQRIEVVGVPSGRTTGGAAIYRGCRIKK